MSDEEDILKTFPTIPDELLSALNRRFPDKMPDMHLPQVEIYMKAGEVRLLRWLKHIRELQRNNMVT